MHQVCVFAADAGMPPGQGGRALNASELIAGCSQVDRALYTAMAVMAWHEWLPGAVLLWIRKLVARGCHAAAIKKRLKP